MIDCFSNFFFSAEKPSSRIGFCDVALSLFSRQSKVLKTLIKYLARQGFRYAGDTNSASKAYTNPKAKKIFIGKDKSLSEALLSLSYELVNAQNAPVFQKIFNEYLNDPIKTSSRAHDYALAILKVEAEAVFMRTQIAIGLKLENLVKNQKYLKIVKEFTEPFQQKEAIKSIFQEMVQNGKVHNGAKKATDHYMEQYFSYSKNSFLRITKS